jgi:hypothetical protein
LGDPLVAAVVARLRRTLARPRPVAERTGGFLLALPGD